jgi:triacylglycerol lipase
MLFTVSVSTGAFLTPIQAAGNNPSPGSTDQPVLLVHGFADSSLTPWWDVLEGYLKDEGFTDNQIYVLNLGNLLTTIKSPEAYAGEVCNKLSDISVDHGGSKVDIIAHSMGGLDSRVCIEQQDGSYYTDDLITLATPHQGTNIALLGIITPGGRDMVPGSPFLDSLNSGSLSDEVEYTAVWGTLDEAMAPDENAKLPSHMTWSTESRNIKAGPYGHISLVFVREVFNDYVMYLD